MDNYYNFCTIKVFASSGGGMPYPKLEYLITEY